MTTREEHVRLAQQTLEALSQARAALQALKAHIVTAPGVREQTFADLTLNRAFFDLDHVTKDVEQLRDSDDYWEPKTRRTT